MKKRWLATSLLALTVQSSMALAIGQKAEVFEKSSDAGLWDHGSEFYLRFDLASIADYKNPTFIWAGLHEESPGLFKGEIKLDDGKIFPSSAKLVKDTDDSRVFWVEITDDSGKLIKEFALKTSGRP